jgi:hypothetical protein
MLHSSRSWCNYACLGIDYGIAGDTEAELEDVMSRMLDDCDVCVLSGGVSMGSLDLLKPLLEKLGTVHFGYVTHLASFHSVLFRFNTKQKHTSHHHCTKQKHTSHHHFTKQKHTSHHHLLFFTSMPMTVACA